MSTQHKSNQAKLEKGPVKSPKKITSFFGRRLVPPSPPPRPPAPRLLPATAGSTSVLGSVEVIDIDADCDTVDSGEASEMLDRNV
jgi:hypothetical protein